MKTWIRSPFLGAVLAMSAISIGCGPMQATLEIKDGSSISIEPPAAAQAVIPAFTTNLTGKIDGAIDINLDLGDLLRLQPTEASLTTDAVEIAGTGFQIGGAVSSGTLCATLDPMNPTRPGRVEISLLRQQITIDATLNTVVSATDPTIGNLVAPIPLSLPVQVRVPFRLGDALQAAGDLLAGQPLDLQFTQEVDVTIPDDVALLGGGRVTGQFNVATAAAGNEDGGGRARLVGGRRGQNNPQNSLLADCAGVFAAAETER